MALLSNDEYKKLVRAGVIGHAVGDAVGFPMETLTREEARLCPATDMEGLGAHFAPAGSWSEDTSMTIATMQSVIDCDVFDYRDIMKKFCSWWLNNRFTPADSIIAINEACSEALNNFYYHALDPVQCGDKREEGNNNNAIMRILPVAYACHRKGFTGFERYDLVRNVASLTNAHEVNIMGCHIYVDFICHLLDGVKPFDAYALIQKGDYSRYDDKTVRSYRRILEGDIANLLEKEIESDNNVVHALEASLWSLLNTDCYRSATLCAANLGCDADTVGAITGSMAGIAYGYDAIPQTWLNKLKKRDYLLDICDNFTDTICK